MKNIILAALIFANAYALVLVVLSLNIYLVLTTVMSLAFATLLFFDVKNQDKVTLLRIKKIFCYYSSILLLIINAWTQLKYPILSVLFPSIWITSILFLLYEASDVDQKISHRSRMV